MAEDKDHLPLREETKACVKDLKLEHPNRTRAPQ